MRIPLSARMRESIAERAGTADMMSWIVVYRDRVHRKVCVSRRFEGRDEALREACALINRGHEVHRLVGPNDEETSREVIEVLCRKMKP